LTTSSNLFLGVDIGGTKVEAMVAEGRDRPLGRTVHATNVSTPEQMVAGVVAAMQEALIQAQVAPVALAAIGIGIPGQVDPETGEVRLAVNLNLTAFPLRAALQSHFRAPIFLENDVRLAALGAYHYVNRQVAVRYLACISVGTGIAAGLILDGRLYRGSSGMAGEIGHTIVDPQGVACHCGLRGCLETVAAGPAIVRQAEAAGLGRPDEPPTVAEVYRAAQQGNPVAVALAGQVGRHLARAVQWLVMASNVEKVVFAGGVSRAGDAFLLPIEQELDRMRRDSSLIRAMIPASAVAIVPADFSAGVWGGIALARQRLTR
jgi:glucokinase